jgi:hypothetical protein
MRNPSIFTKAFLALLLASHNVVEADFQTDIVTTSEDEYDIYGGLHQCLSPIMQERVGTYWAAVGKGHLDGCDLSSYWSAAFISYMVREAGGGAQFCYTSLHANYIYDAFKGKGIYNSAVDVATSTPQMGDLICRPYGWYASWSFSRFQRWANEGGGEDVTSHCDVVVSVSGTNVTAIGGNVRDQVRRETHSKTRYVMLLKATGNAQGPVCQRTDQPPPPPPCFSGDMTVEVHGKGVVRIGDIQVGDKVLASTGYSLVYSFVHNNPKAISEFVQVTTKDGELLEATAAHFVFANGKAIRADGIQVGDLLEGPKGKELVVSNVETVERQGVFDFFTVSGDVFVNGVLASNYVHYVEHTILDENALGHALLSPLRILCTSMLSLQFCRAETYNHDGLSHLGQPFHQVADLVGRMPPALQLTISALAVPPLIVCNVLEHIVQSAFLCTIFFVAAATYVMSKKKEKVKAV